MPTSTRPAIVSSVVTSPVTSGTRALRRSLGLISADLVRPAPGQHHLERARGSSRREPRDTDAFCRVRIRTNKYCDRPATTRPAVTRMVRGANAVLGSVATTKSSKRRQQRDHDQVIAAAERENRDRGVEMPPLSRLPPRQQEQEAGRDQCGVQRIALGVQRLRPERVAESERERGGERDRPLVAEHPAGEIEDRHRHGCESPPTARSCGRRACRAGRTRTGATPSRTADTRAHEGYRESCRRTRTSPRRRGRTAQGRSSSGRRPSSAAPPTMRPGGRRSAAGRTGARVAHRALAAEAPASGMTGTA